MVQPPPLIPMWARSPTCTYFYCNSFILIPHDLITILPSSMIVINTIFLPLNQTKKNHIHFFYFLTFLSLLPNTRERKQQYFLSFKYSILLIFFLSHFFILYLSFFFFFFAKPYITIFIKKGKLFNMLG